MKLSFFNFRSSQNKAITQFKERVVGFNFNEFRGYIIPNDSIEHDGKKYPRSRATSNITQEFISLFINLPFKLSEIEFFALPKEDISVLKNALEYFKQGLLDVEKKYFAFDPSRAALSEDIYWHQRFHYIIEKYLQDMPEIESIDYGAAMKNLTQLNKLIEQASLEMNEKSQSNYINEIYPSIKSHKNPNVSRVLDFGESPENLLLERGKRRHDVLGELKKNRTDLNKKIKFDNLSAEPLHNLSPNQKKF